MGNQVVAAHAEGRNFEFELEGTPVSLGEADVLVDIVKREGYASVSDKGITVVLNTTLTTELIEEGLVRELVSKIQTMRKEAGFEVTDKINITLSGSEKVAAIAEKYASDIMGDTLAVSLTVEAPGGYVKNWDINGEEVELGVERCQ